MAPQKQHEKAGIGFSYLLTFPSQSLFPEEALRIDSNPWMSPDRIQEVWAAWGSLLKPRDLSTIQRWDSPILLPVHGFAKDIPRQVLLVSQELTHRSQEGSYPLLFISNASSQSPQPIHCVCVGVHLAAGGAVRALINVFPNSERRRTSSSAMQEGAWPSRAMRGKGPPG